MSRVGKQPVKVPEKVKVSIKDSLLSAEGPLGKVEVPIHSHVEAVVVDGNVLVKCLEEETDRKRAIQGLTRNLVQNAVEGVSVGFKKELDINGVGFRAEVKGPTLVLTLGFSHPVNFAIPTGIKVAVEKLTHVTIAGSDRQLVGEVAAKIRRLRPPEPYKGKGIKYTQEVIRRKVGKSAAGGK